jgi:hypothetical protein
VDYVNIQITKLAQKVAVFQRGAFELRHEDSEASKKRLCENIPKAVIDHPLWAILDSTHSTVIRICSLQVPIAEYLSKFVHQRA